MSILNIPKQKIKPTFATSYIDRDPPWALEKVEMNMFLAESKKNVTLPHVYLAEYRRELSENYADWFLIHTDGSKSELGVGAAQ